MTNVRIIKEIELYEMSLVTRSIWPGTNLAPGFKILDGTDGREVHAATEVE
jgi:hypothetical protein